MANVHMILSDYPRAFADGQGVAYFSQVASASEYYPFGMLLTDGNYSSGSYRYGFQGQVDKTDDEIYGTGNSYTAEFWQYDAKLGRRWNNDPITFPWQSPYACFNNNPIYFIDPTGLQGEKPPKDAKPGDTWSHTDESGIK
jgi:RHS repeat-associated protein